VGQGDLGRCRDCIGRADGNNRAALRRAQPREGRRYRPASAPRFGFGRVGGRACGHPRRAARQGSRPTLGATPGVCRGHGATCNLGVGRDDHRIARAGVGSGRRPRRLGGARRGLRH
jgi:hypothetical protein